MAYINLLPWRKEAEKAKQREYFTILAAVSFTALAIVLIVSQFYQFRVDGQVSRNNFLKNEIAILDARIAKIKTLNDKKRALQTRIDVVEQLQRSRNVGTKVLDEMAKVVPMGVYLTSIEKKGSILQLVGKTESNNHLANMIREIERSNLFTDAILESITSDEKESKLLSEFKMKVRIVGLADKQLQGEGS